MTNTQRGVKYRVKWRTLCFELLGDICIGCGTRNRQVFTINHVDGDGHKHRHRHTRQPSWKKYCEQIIMGKPRLEIQCYNCHAELDLKRDV